MKQTTIEKFGNTFIQKAYICDQPHFKGNKVFNVGLTWEVQEGDNSYSPEELPATLDNGEDFRQFKGMEWRKALRYAQELAEKYSVPFTDNR